MPADGQHVDRAALIVRSFTQPCRAALVTAGDWARVGGATVIGPEHVLVGLVSVDAASAAALALLGVTREQNEALLARVVPHRVQGAEPDGTQRPFAEPVKSALGGAVRLAAGLRLPQVGTQHLLHALFDPPDPAVASAAEVWGVSAFAIREVALSRRWPQG